MTDALVFGELAADGSTLILMATGPDMRVARAARQLQTLTPLLKPTTPRGGMQLPATWPAVVQLATTFGASWRPGPRLTAWITELMTTRVAQPHGPAERNAQGWTPRDYQLDGAAVIAATGRAMLFDEPGTGKTATTLLGLAQRAAAGHRVTPILVVAPASVVDPWLDQAAAWTPQWRAVAWRGTPAQRAGMAGSAELYVVSYDTCRIDTLGGRKRAENPLLALKPASVVCDEMHLIKSPSAGRSRAVRKLAAQATQFVGLSGTPITHHPGDLWPALEAMVPGAWPSRERWVARYCETVRGDYEETVLGLAPWAEEEFRATLLGQHRRVAKADVLAQLPPKVYSVRSVELPPEWRKVYDSMERDMLAQLPDAEVEGADTELSVMGVLAQMTRLSQLACAAADVKVWTETVPDRDTGLDVEREHVEVTLRAPSWKVDALLEILDERPGRPVVATSPSRQLMKLAGEAATAKGLRVGYVVGGQNAAERTEAIRAFQAGELDLICVTTGAGGVGITLTAADTIVFLQRPWSLVESIQMEDRCHRLGSERHASIEVIDIVAKSTIDTRVRAVLKERAGQLADLVKDPRIVDQLLGGESVKRTRRKAA